MSGSLKARVDATPWFHSIDLGGGIVTPGLKPLEFLNAEAAHIFDPIKVAGASVLDVGAWNGAHSFYAWRRGAAKVRAADQFIWLSEKWRGRVGFEIANEALGAGVEAQQIDVPDISRETVGVWDVALFLGVLYHLPSPLEGLEKVADVAADCLVVETYTDMVDEPRPALAYYPGDTLASDASNFFGPNLAFVTEVLRECGYVKFDSYHGEHSRLIVHAWRNTARRALGNGPESHTRHASLIKPPIEPVVESPPSAAEQQEAPTPVARPPSLLQRMLRRIP